jgi:hypothetical protein
MSAIIFLAARGYWVRQTSGDSGWAQVIEHASRACRVAGVAYGAAVDNKPMGETGPFSRRQQPVKISLDFIGIVLAGETQTARQSFAMRVNNDPGFTEGMAQNNVSGFSSDPCKPGEFLHRRRHRAAELFNQLPRAFFKRPGFGAEKAQAPNDPFDLRCGCQRQGLGIGVMAKKLRRDPVNRLVGALSGKNDGNQKLKCVAVRERDPELGVGPGQMRTDCARALALLLERFSFPRAVSGF